MGIGVSIYFNVLSLLGRMNVRLLRVMRKRMIILVHVLESMVLLYSLVRTMKIRKGLMRVRRTYSRKLLKPFQHSTSTGTTN